MDAPVQPLAWAYPLQRREPASGYAARLAALNGIDLRGLLAYGRIDAGALQRGDATAVRAVAALGNLDRAGAAGLARFTPREPGRGDLPEVAGETLPRRAFERGAVRFCPRCVAEDLAAFDGPDTARPWLRLEWLLDRIRSCRRHRLALAEANPARTRYPVEDFSKILRGDVLPRLDRYLGMAEPAPPSRFEDWIVARIDGIREPANWLDDVPLHAAIRFSEGLGTSLMFDPKVHVSKLTRAQRMAAAERGFAVARVGDAAIGAALQELVDAQIDTRGVLGVRDTYGYLCDALDKFDPGFAKCTDIVRRHAFETLPLEAGTEVLGQRLPERRVHTIHTAAKAADTSPRTMRRIFGRLGVEAAASDRRNHRVTIRADEIAAVLAAYRTAMTTTEVMEATGIPRLHLTAIIAGGHIPALFDSGDQEKAKHRLAREDVEAFMERLFEGAVPVEVPGRRQRSIMQARLVGGASLASIIALVIGGTLRWKGRLGDGRRYEQLLVDADEVRRLLRRPVPRQGLTAGEFARSVPGLRREAVPLLIDHGLIEIKQEFCPDSRRRIPAVTLKSAKAFRSRFVTLGEISDRTGVDRAAARGRLEAAGVDAAFVHHRRSVYLYERRRVAKLLGGPAAPRDTWTVRDPSAGM